MARAFTAVQSSAISRALRSARARSAEEAGGELNIVPLLDIVTNVMLFLLATIATVFTATVPVSSAAVGPPVAAPIDALAVQVTTQGFVVGAEGGYLQSGCTSLGAAAVTVPLRADGAQDFAGLSACLNAARSNPPWRARLAAQRVLRVSAPGAMPYDLLLHTLDAARETRPGAADLFTAPQLGLVL